MIHERYQLSENQKVYLDTYIHSQSVEKPSEMEAWRLIKRPHDSWQISKRPAIIILPGGGYKAVSDREAEPVALTFLKEGFNTFVLYYSIGEDSAYPAPLEDLSKAIWLIRQHAEAWSINPDAIAVMGFSAGAHLAGLGATQWNMPGLANRLGIPEGGNRPNAAVIGYGPVMSEPEMLDKIDGMGAMITKATKEYELYRYVGEHVPPIFIWHTWHDPLVSSKNALTLANVLSEKNRPYELHIFNRGTHGMSVCNDLSDYEAPQEVCPPNASKWVEMCTQWLKEQFHL